MKTKKQRQLINHLRLFVKIHDIVDFGHVSHEDDIEPLKGLSLVNQRRDLYYAHGNIKNREVSLLAREFSLNTKKQKHHDTHLWAIMRVKLDINDAPRIVLDAHQAGNDIYSHYHHTTHQLRNIDDLINNPSFKGSFHSFIELNRVLDFDEYITDQVMQNLYDYFQAISFEIHNSHVYIFVNDSIVSQKKLDKMLEAGFYLAEHIEYADANLHRHKSVPLQLTTA